ncbi:MAG: polyphosphate kinase 1 [Bacteroidetes bacterium]|nr:polyphosphate kinase 1 [Bacteroidota bacterium]MBS1930108.1 polyphosphate kinase 1 [Bacteroidota bacterium]
MSEHHKKKIIGRDISWLAFNARVLQEAADATVPLRERVRFLGIFSNNLDEFFRVRVAALKRMIQLGEKANMHLEESPQTIIDEIQMIVLNQQSEFYRIWEEVLKELNQQNIFLKTEKNLNPEQQEFVRKYYDEEVSPNVIPLMIESIPELPNLRDKSIYLAVVMWKKESALKRKYALIEIPDRDLNRFLQLPSPAGEHHILLLEDVIRFNLPEIFSFFGYDQYQAHVFKVTRDAEIDIDNDISTSLIQKIEKGIKNRKKGKPVRFVYDREMDPGMLEFLIRKLNLSKKDNLIPGGRVHNFRHFMDFPEEVFKLKKQRKKPFEHPLLRDKRVTDVLIKRDVMLSVPYHSFNPIIDLLREAAIDPDITSIKITCYRLAQQSKIINALINAVRNGKQVTVMLELTARFDEEANLEWKERLEEEGVKVLIGIQNMKVHAKICVIRKKTKDQNFLYGFVGTGNLNEKTAKLYADHFLLTSNQKIMADANRVFGFITEPKNGHLLKECTTLIPSPWYARKELLRLIDVEIRHAKKKKNKAGIILKMNSLSDETLILKLYEAAKAGVEIKLIVRGICCMMTQNAKFERRVFAISIVDEYLEHARVWVFHNKGHEKVYISSADWMVRNLDHRVEVTCPVYEETIKKEMIDILNIQLHDNVKARWLDNVLSNEYVSSSKKKIRSQVETYNYLYKKSLIVSEISSH